MAQPSDVSGDDTKQLAQPVVKTNRVNIKGDKGSEPGLITYGTGDAVTGNVDYSPWWGDNYVGDPHTTPWNWYVDTNNSSTIQEGIDIANEDDIVNVTADTYTENIILNKVITLLGADRTTTIIDGSANITAGATFSSFTVGSAAQGVFISGEDVIVDDCHIEITAPSAMNVVQIYPASGARNVTIINSVIVAQDNSSNPAGIYWEIGAIAEGFLLEGCTITSNYGVTNNWGSDGTIIRDNTFIQIAGGTEYAIGLKTPITNALIENNVINGFEFGIRIDNNYAALGDGPIIIRENQISNSDNEEIKLRRGKGIEVYDNTLTGDPSNPCIVIYDDYTDLEVIGINGNSILGPSSLQNDRTEIIDATENYWGTLNCPIITASISGNVDFDPYCNDDFSDCSFTCDLAEVWVDDDYCDGCGNDSHTWNYDAFDNIIDAVTAVTGGGTVNVAAGTYDENPNIDKSLIIQGSGPTSTLVNPAGTAPVFTVSANDVTLTQMGITNSTQLVEGIRVSGATSGLTLDYVNFPNLGNNPGPGNAYGVNIMNDFTGLLVTNSEFVATNLGEYSRAIGIFAGNDFQLSNFQVDDSKFEYLFVGMVLVQQAIHSDHLNWMIAARLLPESI